MPSKRPVRYKDAGVNIDEADRAVAFIKKHAKKTFTPGVMTDIGAFGAGYRLAGWKQPVLISSADGVGTKLKVAFLTGKHDTVGEDLVNHCVNDIAVQGAVPLFFLDYFAVGKLKADVVSDVVAGIARGCKGNGCALIGGETAEMPGLYAAGEYDLAGFIVGAAEKKAMITGAKVGAGDLLLGLPSTGLHTNGYSLARKLLFEQAGYSAKTYMPELECTIGEELLKVHRSYLKPLQALAGAGLLKAAAHITGGGITENLPRVLPPKVTAEIDSESWPVLPVFKLLKRIGRVPDDDYRRTFNLGIGMIFVVGARNATKAQAVLDRMSEPCYRIGHLAPAPRAAKAKVIYR
ncbi:MAG: phosphoribosylformylglycinamidine cyclo-ligase [Acidobacteria bacterium]|nr:phosphoribosylformylglycinamidine cyclo-ligase [Acidobacteriota bacterium]